MSLCFGTKHKILAPSSLKFFLSKVYSKCEWNTLYSVGRRIESKVCGMELDEPIVYLY